MRLITVDATRPRLGNVGWCRLDNLKLWLSHTNKPPAGLCITSANGSARLCEDRMAG